MDFHHDNGFVCRSGPDGFDGYQSGIGRLRRDPIDLDIQQLTRRFQQATVRWQDFQLIGKVTGHESIGARDAAHDDRHPRFFCHGGNDFRTDAATLVVFVDDDQACRLFNRREHGMFVPG